MKRLAAPTTERPPARRPASSGTSEHQGLSKYIRARYEDCSRSQKDVAQYIVDHLDEAAFQTAEELARRANTSSSTVVWKAASSRWSTMYWATSFWEREQSS